MSIDVGARFGSLEITALLGKGGMGEVYRARDTKLKRDVAIKTLPDEFSHDADRLNRFQREAEVLASLNHPNIAAIYDLQEAEGARFLVLELVEGQALADRIQQGPIPVDEALQIAKGICEALEAAHEQGIVHRDLKPANIKITPEGRVKVLDFGLAKAMEQSPATTLSNSPTLMSVAASNAGVILGTAGYMSPEQAKGKTVDRRADVWAFGVVLYEMLTGRMLFSGETVPETMAFVMTKEPDWAALPKETPLRLRELLRRCLIKESRSRIRDIGDVRIALEEGFSQTEAPQPQKNAVPWMLAVGVSLVAGVAMWASLRGAPAALLPLVRLSIDPPGFAMTPELTAKGPSIALSPDGTRLVYTARGPDGRLRLHTRPLDQEQVTLLAGTEDAYNPFFSPDGQWIAFFTPGKLKKVALVGGAVVDLCDAPAGYGGSWGDDDNIIAALNPVGGLSKISANGGRIQPLTQLKTDNQETVHRFPQVVSGADAVLFTANSNRQGDLENAQIEVQSLRTGDRRTLLTGGSYGRYVPSGHLVFMRQGVLYAAPMDGRRMILTGPAAPAVESVASSANYGFAQLDVSRSGTLVYVRGRTTNQTLVWLEGGGRVQPLRTAPAVYSGPPRFSPDGKRLAVGVSEGGNTDVWTYDWERDTLTRLTFTPGRDFYPVWSPDGSHIAFSSSRDGKPENLYWMRADGAGEAIRLTESKNSETAFSFSPDGTQLAFAELGRPTNWDLWTLPLQDPRSNQGKFGKPEVFLQTASDERWPMVSPDGRWLAYGSDESGRFEIYVRRFPGPGGKWQISTEGGERPIWSKTRPELFYRNSKGMMVASYTVSGEAFGAVKAQVWAEKKDLSLDYDLTPDGTRFAVIEAGSTDETSRPQLTFLLNFFDELRRIAPPSKK
jgi:serine/threonine-protein kinase